MPPMISLWNGDPNNGGRQVGEPQEPDENGSVTFTAPIADVARETVFGVVGALLAGDLDTAEFGLEALNELLQR